jgi:putative membrane protein
MQLLLRWLTSAIALYITVYLGRFLHLRFWVAPGLLGIEGVLLAATVLGIINAVIRPIILFFTVPLTCMTLGLFALVVNALLFWLAGNVVPGFHVAGWEAPLFGAVVMGIASGLLNLLIRTDKEKRRS